MLTVDIDVGGTLTDGLFTAGERVVSVKVDTTPHDLTVCLFDCLTQGATQLGYPDLDTFLEDVGLIRWSTTLTSNVLAELRGPKLGLIVSPGHGADFYGDEQTSRLLMKMVPASTVLEMEASAQETTVTSAVRSLLEGGVRRICISLKAADRDAAPEIRMKRIIEQQYPDHFLGSVPVLAGSDVFPGADDATRTACALINAYTHGALAATLFKAEDELRETHRYTGSFFVSHINGGVAGIAKTRAIDTMESGPILGIHGSSYLAKVLGLPDVMALDVGGTTAKLSALQDSQPIVRKPSDLFGISLGLSLPYLRSIALGGGSVVKAAPAERQVALGPESMGSYPGPACYGLGGDQATLTDAFVCAGLIDPNYFLGGAKPLHPELARNALEEHVAGPLHISVEQACSAIMDRAFQAVAEMVANAKTELQLDLSRHTVFAYGGNGGLFACGVAESAGLDRVYMFSLGPVFSAFGSSSSDICHVYERPLHLTSFDDADLRRLRQSVEQIRAEGLKDLLGEGIQPDDMSFALEVDVSRGNGHTTAISTPEEALENPKSLRAHVQKAFDRQLAGDGGAKWVIDLARLQVRKMMPKPALRERALQSADPSHARKGSRTVVWGGKCVAAQLYRWESLQPGNRVEGCALLESPYSTYFVPAGWLLEMDAYGNAKLSRK
ncbi:MAG TPA: hydantoinase/oxoprolinase family protein [Terriglobales bacterium]|nr:hydantoinase/oxoprolinase family protein [Terriglobales bacterium]